MLLIIWLHTVVKGLLGNERGILERDTGVLANRSIPSNKEIGKLVVKIQLARCGRTDFLAVL